MHNYTKLQQGFIVDIFFEFNGNQISHNVEFPSLESGSTQTETNLTQSIQKIALQTLACLGKYLCPCFQTSYSINPSPPSPPLPSTPSNPDPITEEQQPIIPISLQTLIKDFSEIDELDQSPFLHMTSSENNRTPTSLKKSTSEDELNERINTPVKLKSLSVSPTLSDSFYIGSITSPSFTPVPRSDTPIPFFGTPISFDENLFPLKQSISTSSQNLSSMTSKETFSTQHSRDFFRSRFESLFENMERWDRDDVVAEIKKCLLFLKREENRLLKSKKESKEEDLEKLKKEFAFLESKMDLITEKLFIVKEEKKALKALQKSIETFQTKIHLLDNRSFKTRSILGIIKSYRKTLALYEQKKTTTKLSEKLEDCLLFTDIEKTQKTMNPLLNPLHSKSFIKLLEIELSIKGSEKEITDLKETIAHLYKFHNIGNSSSQNRNLERLFSTSRCEERELKTQLETKREELLTALEKTDPNHKDRIISNYPVNTKKLTDLLNGFSEDSFLDDLSLEQISRELENLGY